MTIERTTCSIQRPVWGTAVPQPVPGRVNLQGQQEVQLQMFPFYDTAHEFRLYDKDNYELYCVHCGQRTTEAAYQAIIEGERNTMNLAKEPPRDHRR